MSKQDKNSETETENGIVLYIKKYKNATYPTKYGIEFQCVELIRRFFFNSERINISGCSGCE